MRKISLQLLLRLFLAVALLAGALVILPRAITKVYSKPRLYSVDDAPAGRVAIVFGAGLWRDGTPSRVLRDRVATAAQLYFAGKVEKLLMTGDNSHVSYNEPGAMRDYAIRLGVPEEAIVLDYAGRRTYDSCYRAAQIFGLQEATLVTQSFHLPRALYLCNRLGVKAVGVPADMGEYRRSARLFWEIRELPATLRALVEVHITRPLPILGQAEPIFSQPITQ